MLALEPELITYLFTEEREKRRRVAFEELPDHLVKAVLAIEDRRFFSHPGLDPIRLVGAVIRNVRSDSAIPQGGSTITQQLCKNFFLTPERSYRRKAQEALLAFVLERRATKQEILELYLNEIYLGQSGSFSINGMGEAARTYFHKDVTNLTIPEAALLAGMIQSPNPYNPFRHEKRATERRNEVIRAMREAGFIDAKQTEEALARAAARRAGARRQDRRAVLRRPRAPAARPAVRPEGPHHPEPARSTRASTCSCSRSRQAALERGLDRVQEMIKKRTTAAGAGLPDRARAGERQGRGPRGRPLVRREPVQPRGAGAPAARQHVQAVRLPRRVRGRLRRPEPAADHAGDRRRGRALRVLLRGQGVHPDELRGRVPRHGDAAPRARDEHERRHGQGRGDGRLRQGRADLVEEARHRRADPALSPPSPSARSRRRRTRWRPPTTCSPTTGSRSSR